MKTLVLLLLGISVLYSQKKEKVLEQLKYEESLNKDSLIELNAEGKFHSIDIQFHTGGIIYGGESLKPDIHQFYSTTAKFGWQNSKKDAWSKWYGSPIYGFGLYAGNIGNRQVFGNPRAAYGFITFQTSKFFRKNVFQISPSLGLTYQLAKYDPVLNPDNDAISSNVSLYFNMEFSFSYQLTRELDLRYGIDFMHSSNGRLFTPNWGLNFLGVDLGLRYYYNRGQKNKDPYVYTTNVVPSRYHRMKKAVNERLGSSAISTYFAVGNVENYSNEDGVAPEKRERYWTNSIALDYNYLYNTMFSFTGGFDYFRDTSLQSYYPNSKDWNLFGYHAGADFNFWRMAVRFQAGGYIGSNRGKDGLWMRPAFLYKVNDWFKVQVGLKTRRGAGADWIEWGVVFVPFRWGGNK